MDIIPIVRGKCAGCGYSRNVWLPEMVAAEAGLLQCDHVDRGCSGKFIIVYRGKPSGIPASCKEPCACDARLAEQAAKRRRLDQEAAERLTAEAEKAQRAAEATAKAEQERLAARLAAEAADKAEQERNRRAAEQEAERAAAREREALERERLASQAESALIAQEKPQYVELLNQKHVCTSDDQRVDVAMRDLATQAKIAMKVFMAGYATTLEGMTFLNDLESTTAHFGWGSSAEEDKKTYIFHHDNYLFCCRLHKTEHKMGLPLFRRTERKVIMEMKRLKASNEAAKEETRRLMEQEGESLMESIRRMNLFEKEGSQPA